MRKVEVKFPGNSKVYCYRAPKGTKRGDVVRVPVARHWYYTNHSPQYATVTSGVYRGDYRGPIKDVIEVYRKVEQ